MQVFLGHVFYRYLVCLCLYYVELLPLIGPLVMLQSESYHVSLRRAGTSLWTQILLCVQQAMTLEMKNYTKRLLSH